MPTRTDDQTERGPTFTQIRSCLPHEARHTVLRLMPLGPRAPEQYRQLQECIYATLAPGRTSLERAEALSALWSMYDASMPSVPDAEALLIEVAQHVVGTAFTFQAAEILAAAELNQRGIYLDEGKVEGMALALPILTRGKHGPLEPDERTVPRLQTISHAIQQLTGRTEADLAAMPEGERLAAIRLLRVFLVYGKVADTRDTAGARKSYFDRLGSAVWQALMSPGFTPDVDVHLYGRPALNRMGHALRSSASAAKEDEVVAPLAGTAESPIEPPDGDLAHPAQAVLLSGLQHLVVRERFPPPRDRDDQVAMQPYERLRQAMTLAPLPTVELLDQCREVLLTEFPWVDNVIDGLFDELRAKRLTGALVLSFSPILLKGPAGCGKTRFARRLAEVLDLPAHALNLGGSIDAMAILGTNRGWSTAQPSPLLRPLLGGRATALVIVDEVDKRGDLSRNNPPVESALLPLLDPEEARRWRDGFLQVECDLRCLQWVMTCNDVTWLSAAFLSRVRVYEIRRPTRAELRSVVAFALRDVESDWGLPAGVFTGAPVAQMLPSRILSLRELRKAVSRAVAAWVRVTAGGPRH